MKALEEKLQINIVENLRVLLTPETEFWHTPNGGFRHVSIAKKLKDMGTQRGVPDLQFVHKGRAYFIEMKAPDGVLSPSQKEFIPRLEACGCPVSVCQSWPEVEGALAGWGIPTRIAK